MRDYIFKRLLFLCSLLVLLICGGMVYSLVSGAVPAFEKFGFFHFISSVEWDPRPGNEQYGALAFITGTIMTSFLALVFCIPFSLPVALFTGEYFRGTRAATIIGSVIDLLAGGAAKGRSVLADAPRPTRDEYSALWRDILAQPGEG